VVVLEREQQGPGSSLANAGWVVPAMSTPLAGPGVLGSIAATCVPALVLRGERGAGLAPFRADRFGARIRRTARDRTSSTKCVRS
jgi:hypothetical protein